MQNSALASPTWDAVEKLQRDLVRVERAQPGSLKARDIEAALDLLLDDRISSTNPRYLARDAVRRAGFLRRQADAQHAVAAARLRPAHTITGVRPPRADRRSDAGQSEYGSEPLLVAPVDVEDIVCTNDLADRIVAATSASGPPVAAVFDGLRRDLRTTAIAEELAVSPSTVRRTVAALREHAATVLTTTMWAAA